MSFKVWIQIEDHDESRDPESIECDVPGADEREFPTYEQALEFVSRLQYFSSICLTDDDVAYAKEKYGNRDIDQLADDLKNELGGL